MFFIQETSKLAMFWPNGSRFKDTKQNTTFDHSLTSQLSQNLSTIPFYSLYILLIQIYHTRFFAFLPSFPQVSNLSSGPWWSLAPRSLSSEALACLQSLRPVTLPTLHVLPLVAGRLLSEGDLHFRSLWKIFVWYDWMEYIYIYMYICTYILHTHPRTYLIICTI